MRVRGEIPVAAPKRYSLGQREGTTSMLQSHQIGLEKQAGGARKAQRKRLAAGLVTGGGELSPAAKGWCHGYGPRRHGISLVG